MAVMLVGFLVVGINALSTIAVGGPYYRNIIQSKELVADILPPPVYIVETHLLAATMLADKDSSNVEQLVERLNRLSREYDVRHDYWQNELKEGIRRDLLLTTSYAPAKEYFRVVTTDYVKAIQQGDMALAQSIFVRRLVPLFAEHREAVVQLVNVEVERNVTLEAEVESAVRTQAAEMFLVVGFIVCIALLLAIVVSRSIVIPLNEATAAASALVAGREDVVVKYKGSDELGELADSFRTLAGYVHDVADTNRQVAESLQRVLQRFSQVSLVRESDAARSGYKAIFALINSHKEKPS